MVKESGYVYRVKVGTVYVSASSLPGAFRTMDAINDRYGRTVATCIESKPRVGMYNWQRVYEKSEN